MEQKHEWIRFRPNLGTHQRQQLPPERKHVLVQVMSKDPTHLPDPIAVGYLRYAGGDRLSPFFVTPGVGGNCVAWMDCLPEDVDFARCTP